MVSRSLLFSAVVAAALALGPLPAALATDDGETPSELARESMERMLRAIELMIEMVPQYEMPEVNENGDIIIRRKNAPSRRDDSDDEPEVDETRT